MTAARAAPIRACDQVSRTMAAAVDRTARNSTAAHADATAGKTGSGEVPVDPALATTVRSAIVLTVPVWMRASPTACPGTDQRDSSTTCSPHTAADARVSTSPGPNPLTRRLSTTIPPVASATPPQVALVSRSRKTNQPARGAITTSRLVRKPDVRASV
jgi:hypothetical protein